MLLEFDPHFRPDSRLQVDSGVSRAEVEAIADRQHFQPDARTDTGAIEILQQFAVALEEADDHQALTGECLFERLEAALAARRRRIHTHDIAVRAGVRGAETFHQFALEVGGDGVLQLFGLLVNLVPFQAEDLGEHALDEMVAIEQAAGDLAAGRGEGDLALGGNADERVALQPLNGHGYGRRGHVQPSRQGDGFDGFAFRFGLGDGLEVVLLGKMCIRDRIR